MPVLGGLLLNCGADPRDRRARRVFQDLADDSAPRFAILEEFGFNESGYTALIRKEVVDCPRTDRHLTPQEDEPGRIAVARIHFMSREDIGMPLDQALECIFERLAVQTEPKRTSRQAS